MNKQTLLILLGLALPVVALTLLVSTASNPPATVATPPKVTPPLAKASNNPAPAPQAKAATPTSLEQERERVQKWLADIKRMTPQQWAEERKTHPNRAPTIEAAIENNNRWLDRLNKMSPEEWSEISRPKERTDPAPAKNTAQTPAPNNNLQPAR